MTHRLSARVISLIIFSCAQAVNANATAIALPEERPAAFDGPWLVAGSAEVERASVTIQCRALVHEESPYCSFDFLVWVTNPKDTPESIQAVVFAAHARSVHTTIPRNQFESVNGPEAARPELTVRADTFQSPRPGQRGSMAVRQVISMTLASGQRVPLKFSGHFVPPARWIPSWGYDALEARHPVYGRTSSSIYAVNFFTEALGSWGGEPTVDVVFEVTRGWPMSFLAVQTNRKGYARELFLDTPTLEADGPITHSYRVGEVDAIFIRVRRPSPTHRVGGVFFGAGGYFDDTKGGFVRAGYEFSLPGWLIWEASLDSNMTNFLAASMTVSAASDGVLCLPSAAIGLGPTLQWASQIAPGARAQVTLHYPHVGLTAHLDYLPTLEAAHPRALQVGMLGRVGF